MIESTPDSILKELQPIFQEALETPDITIARESSPANTPGWDSFAQIAIIEMVESRFAIKIGLADLEKVKNAGTLADLIQAKTSTR